MRFFFKWNILGVLLTLCTVIHGQTVAINEVMASNYTTIQDEDGDYVDWIELYNYGSEPLPLGGYGLSDREENPFKWVLPDILILPGQYLLIWASGKDRSEVVHSLHTNFSVRATGEDILLTRPDGVLEDRAPATSMPADVSYGRQPDGIGDWFFFYTPTPSAANTGQGLGDWIRTPIFSHHSGFYSDSFLLSISYPDSQAQIIYTLDGSTPDMEDINGRIYTFKNQYPHFFGNPTGPLHQQSYTSRTYEGPFVVRDRSPEPDKLSHISSTWEFAPDYFPDHPSPKGTVVRARAYVQGVPGPVVSHTFFVSAQQAFDHVIPVLSLCTNEDHLFDYQEGIYVAGADFDQWRQANPFSWPGLNTGANFFRRGRETEKPAHIRYFEDGLSVLDQHIGLRIHGGWSRHQRLKSFRLYARSSYDVQSRLNHPFFADYPHDSFKRLMLRNSGNDYNFTYIRDAVIHHVVQHLRFDTHAYQPSVVYLNGEYFGIMNIRERYDRHYLERMYGIEEGALDLLTNNAQVNEGDNTHFLSLRQYVASQDLSDSTHYAYVIQRLDPDNYMDYCIANIYVRNTDWPGNNVKFFRKRTTEYEPQAPFGQDGRWRWLMFDMDFGLGTPFGPGSEDPPAHNTLAFATLPGGTQWPNPNWSTVILRNLLENPSFRSAFILRFADQMNTAFLPERIVDVIDAFQQRIAPEISAHRQRWNRLNNWEFHVQRMRDFATERPPHQRQHIREYFNLPGEYTATLDVADPATGYVRINTIDITPATPGVPAHPYPWSGIYYHTLPITITAIPQEGYAFSHWTGHVLDTVPMITIMPDEDIYLMAHFKPEEVLTDDRELIYFWLMDNSLPNDTPLEEIESTWSRDGQQASLLFTSALEGYPYDNTHPLWRKSSMERRNRPTPLNYRPEANDSIPYEQVNMRGLQIRQVMHVGGHENTLYLDLDTRGYEDILLTMAAMDEGAADQLVFDYWDPHVADWSTEGLDIPVYDLSAAYKVLFVDFMDVLQATNREQFRIRIRFAGEDMEVDSGDRVTFNNIAVSGTALEISAYQPQTGGMDLRVHPNPTTGLLYVQSELLVAGAQLQLYDVLGRQQMSLSDVAGNQVRILDLSGLPSGIYTLVLRTVEAVLTSRVVVR
jgi:hypothetical protein